MDRDVMTGQAEDSRQPGPKLSPYQDAARLLEQAEYACRRAREVLELHREPRAQDIAGKVHKHVRGLFSLQEDLRPITVAEEKDTK